MAANTTQKEFDSFCNDITFVAGGLMWVLGLGLWQLRKVKKLLLVVATAIVGTVAVMLLKLPLWIVPLPPLVAVLAYGYKRQEEIDFYRKAFMDVGFKGRDGKAPYLISRCNLGNYRTGCYFRSNISLQQWKKSLPELQTALDCTILSVKSGKSRKITHIISIPADIELKEMLPFSSELMSLKSSVIVLGESIAGKISFDLNNTPHWIFAGSTGSGKSVLMRLAVYQCLVKGHKVYLMDFKRGVEFGKVYDDFCEVIMDKARAVTLLTELVEENRHRLDMFRQMGIHKLDEYNAIKKDDPLERIVVFIDELAILLLPTKEKGDRELTAQATDCLENVAILGRAAGINMIFGIQRPDANTVTGQIKSNVSGRVCGYFADVAPSMIVLGNTRATEIDSELKGRFMYQDGKETIEMQGYYQDESQVVDGIVDSRSTRYTPQGSSPELPTKKQPKLPKPPKQRVVLNGYDEEDTA